MTLSRFLPIRHIVIEDEKHPRVKMVGQYLLTAKLGLGISSKVYLAQFYGTDMQSNTTPSNNRNKKYYAAKVINLNSKNIPNQATSLEREIKIMRLLNHPSIIKLHTVLYAQSKSKVYVIMEWADCGTLQNAISLKNKFDEQKIASVFIQIALGLSYLHSKGFAHLDVKPSNILLFSDGTAKLSDFGISHSFKSAESVFGTPSYQAPDLFDDGDSDPCDIDDVDPNIDKNDFSLDNDFSSESKKEILDQKASAKNNYLKKGHLKRFDPKKGDVWSLGISMYQTAFGVLPYEGKNLYEIVNKIKSTDLSFPDNDSERKYSPEFINLLSKMLEKNQEKRLPIDEIINHPFFTRFQYTELENQEKYNSGIISIKGDLVMKKVPLGIKPFQPPEFSESDIVKIDAFTFPENCSFNFGKRSSSFP